MGHWYAIRTNIKCEHKARQNLRRAGYGVYLPEMRIERQHKRTKKWLTKTLCLMPRYLFVQMPDGPEDWYNLRKCEGVECVMGIEGQPIPIRPEDGEHPVERLMEMQSNLDFDDTRDAKIKRREIGRNKRETTKMKFPVGSRVRAKDGPFATFRGYVTNVKAKGEVAVLLNVFGRMTPCDFPSDWVEAAE